MSSPTAGAFPQSFHFNIVKAFPADITIGGSRFIFWHLDFPTLLLHVVGCKYTASPTKPSFPIICLKWFIAVRAVGDDPSPVELHFLGVKNQLAVFTEPKDMVWEENYIKVKCIP